MVFPLRSDHSNKHVALAYHPIDRFDEVVAWLERIDVNEYLERLTKPSG